MANRIVDELLAAAELDSRPAEADAEKNEPLALARRQLDHWRHELEQVVGAHPAASVAAAVAVGIAVGWWIKRK